MSNEKYTQEELERLVNSEDWKEREKAAEAGYKLDQLVKDKNYRVRKAVAISASKLNRIDLIKKLHHDKNEQVRITAYFAQSTILDRLIKAKDNKVQLATLNALNEALINGEMNDWLTRNAS